MDPFTTPQSHRYTLDSSKQHIRKYNNKRENKFEHCKNSYKPSVRNS